MRGGRAAHRRRRWSLRAVIVGMAAAALLTACASLDSFDYYWQGAAGQLDLLSRSEPIPEAMSKGDPTLAARLLEVQQIRRFASRELGLPDNGSYTRYADLGRPFVTWSVFATPMLSLEPRRWCFPVAGCVDYRGYFDESAARREAARLKADGDDVYVGGVPAYSTLGWFDDPVLSTFIRWPETEVARLVFHELAHQLLYVKDDSVFNESFATTVEEVGLERWLAAQKNPVLDAQAARADRLRAVFRHLVRTTREKLSQVYASDLDTAAKLRAKREAFAAMEAAYEAARAGEPGLAGYDRWFAQGPSNASLAAVGIYTDRIPAFRELLREEDADLPRFYARVRAVAAMARSERDQVLDAAAERGRAYALAQRAAVAAAPPGRAH
ncbi:MAG TPA: aminopeptidase [Casimicrobiaceae bacterium]|nr:aminopeptidase [Casimicrobiaceae bacterium]